jgi:hypothetical protein
VALQSAPKGQHLLWHFKVPQKVNIYWGTSKSAIVGIHILGHLRSAPIGIQLGALWKSATNWLLLGALWQVPLGQVPLYLYRGVVKAWVFSVQDLGTYHI